ncbi:carbohydrate kinase family protein [Agromyces mangrovi Wang et al. 2018]|uniref:carbohydrate kinase family protein n=1 Tax=Agromyces mangrovi TaxID=1858653 RepID=UPI002572BBC3|nr:PfkB family carbohydrate kinase [Agromyces mangrovi]BDZ65721.1 adenosine kinase [Agromyces mangrovi]
MPSPAEPGVLVVAGDLVEDVVVWLAEPTRHATDTAARIVRSRGGSAANVAAFAAGTGAPARFVGCVGADAAGDGLAHGLASTGVDVRLQRAGTTGTVVLLVDPDGERTMYPDRGAAAELRRPIDPSVLDGAGWLHVPAYGLEREPARSAVVTLADAARESGVGVSLDVSSTGLIDALGVSHFLALVTRIGPDIVFANADEAALLGIGSAADPAATRPEPLAPLTVVKRGPHPAEVLRPGRPALHVPATAVDDVRDATGAGDAFAAGFLVATMAGADPRAACVAGHALAASVLGSPGASVALA